MRIRQSVTSIPALTCEFLIPEVFDPIRIRRTMSGLVRLSTGGVSPRDRMRPDTFAPRHLCGQGRTDSSRSLTGAPAADGCPGLGAGAEIYRAGGAGIEAAKKNFRDFVAFCKRKEQETGEPVLIVASY